MIIEVSKTITIKGTCVVFKPGDKVRILPKENIKFGYAERSRLDPSATYTVLNCTEPLYDEQSGHWSSTIKLDNQGYYCADYFGLNTE